MEVYQTKTNIIPGTNFKAVENIALVKFKAIRNKSKRTPYVRSAYFKKQKVFLNIFWSHLHQKRDRMERLRYFDCAIDLIKKSKCTPNIFVPKSSKNEKLHRFLGKTKDGKVFCVQIKENIRTKRKDLISMFPLK